MNEIKELVRSYCEKHLNDELMGYALKLCDTLGRKKKIDISRGRKEIWAASVIYAIARLNFLFDKENPNYITTDTICNYFNTKKSTVGSKATKIEEACNLTIGTEGYCGKHITDTLTFYQTPEGFVIPKSMIGDRELVVEVMDKEESKEFEKLIENERKVREQEVIKKREERAEKKRQIAEEKRKNRDYEKRQLNLFGD